MSKGNKAQTRAWIDGQVKSENSLSLGKTIQSFANTVETSEKALSLKTEVLSEVTVSV